jgi:hypothetical protein
MFLGVDIALKHLTIHLFLLLKVIHVMQVALKFVSSTNFQVNARKKIKKENIS